MNDDQYKGQFFDIFGILVDKREEGKVWHKLIDILFIIVTATFCKIDKVEEIYIWASAERNIEWLKRYVELANGVPSVSTFRRALRAIDPKQFEKCFMIWVKELTVFSGGDIVAIDGKTMRGSRDGGNITHIVSAWCSANNLVLGQVKTEAKSNEITAIPVLIELLYLEGCIVTIDAMGCQTEIVKAIRKKKADYVISLKGNQGTLHNEVKDYYEDIKEEIPEIEEGENEKIGFVETLEKGHGRIERRKYYFSTDLSWMKQQKKEWDGLKGIGMVYRKVTKKDSVTEEVQHYISSLNDVDEFAKSVRKHWGVESYHWSLDVTLKDDADTTRKDNTPENLAVARRIVLNMVRNEKEIYPKYSANSKRLTASLDEEYRTKVFDLNFKKA